MARGARSREHLVCNFRNNRRSQRFCCCATDVHHLSISAGQKWLHTSTPPYVFTPACNNRKSLRLRLGLRARIGLEWPSLI